MKIVLRLVMLAAALIGLTGLAQLPARGYQEEPAELRAPAVTQVTDHAPAGCAPCFVRALQLGTLAPPLRLARL